jgi:uncharacterized protein
MTIDWAQFTPWASLVGGLLIGAAVSIFVLINGRVAGISGILGGLLAAKPGDLGWRVAFLAGLVCAPWGYLIAAEWPASRIDAGAVDLAVAGFLVGIGTRYGSGCTSGHGVCGMARWSPRSLAATAVFMAAGVATVFVARHALAR